jgi:hypothetical protein
VPARRPEATAAAFHRAAAEAGVAYALIGGLAVGAWGQPRATQDVDCLVDLPRAAEERFCRALAAQRLGARADDLRAAREGRSHATVLDEEGPFHVDLKLALTAEEKDQVREAVDVTISTGPVRVARPEDTVAYKVRFGTEQDLRDARSIVVRQAGKLDEARLLALALRLGVAEQVRALLRAHGRG